MNGWWTSVVGGALLLVACGQTTSPHADSNVDEPRGGASSGGTTPITAGSSGAGGDSSSSGSGVGGLSDITPDPPQGTAGTTSTDPDASRPLPDPHPAIACQDPQPLPSGGGFELCADGTARRREAADCVTVLPRREPAPGRLYDECEYDADCAEKPHGYCVIGSCFYGCVSDSECGTHALCVCGDVVGTCQSGCVSDADCPTDYPCSGVVSSGSIGGFSCQTPYDECLSDNDCNEFDSKMHCESDGMRRLCVRRIVG